MAEVSSNSTIYLTYFTFCTILKSLEEIHRIDPSLWAFSLLVAVVTEFLFQIKYAYSLIMKLFLALSISNGITNKKRV